MLLFFFIQLIFLSLSFSEDIPLTKEELLSLGKENSGKELDFIKELPKSLDWRNINGINYMPPVRNQHIPQYCGCCWAKASSSALAARFNIALNNTMGSLLFSVQDILDNSPKGTGTCHGGVHLKVYDYAFRQGLVTESCNNYKAADLTTPRCQTCDSQGNCIKIEKYQKFKTIHYAHLTSYEAIKQEIMKRGPISCSIYASSKFHNYTGGVFSEYFKNKVSTNHVITVLGWGEDENGEYWIGQNSWGSNWGDNGFFKVVTSRDHHGTGSYNIGIEGNCAWGQPLIEDWMLKIAKDSTNQKEKRTFAKKIPDQFDWRNVGDGKLYVSPIRGQNEPQYCKVDSIMAFTSTFADILNIRNKGKWPNNYLSVQHLFTCAKEPSSCDLGLDLNYLLDYAVHEGVPQDSCNNFHTNSIQRNETCNDITRCADCTRESCFPILNYKRYYLSSYSSIGGIENMKNEIFKNGPIICKLFNSNSFQTYSGGIFEDKESSYNFPNFYVEIVGFGKSQDDGKEFWIGRNSIGYHWGENGWFRIVTSKYGENLGIESECTRLSP